ncbi:circadian clock KaiB family protein [Desulfococcaceae bacterium HSG9]|nr:circadian clock KaiB family protein [Desulfococcaceae bacterium HSG9]
MTTDNSNNGIYTFTLFVADNKPNSAAARRNLELICQTCFTEHFEIIIIDILQNFQAALDNDILASPALLASLPHGEVTIIGDLSDTQNVLTALGVAGNE